MKLLFDHNISPRLCELLSDLYPGSTHVFRVNMDREDDSVVWSYAGANGFTIVSKDSDFHQLAFVKGPPPKVIWIQLGNCSTQAIIDLLSRHHGAILEFERDEVAAFLALR